MKKIIKYGKYALIVVLCLAMLLFEFIPELKSIQFTQDKVYNRLISLSIPLALGGIAVLLISAELGIKLFGKPEKLLVLLPAIIIALDNFPWLAYFADKMTLTHTKPLHFLLFSAYCLLVGFFEEVLFRGILFSLIASLFQQTKKGFLLTYIVSSVAFGLVHLLNVFSAGGAAVLQAGYSILTGGLFAFVLIKTKNIVFPAMIHAIYNFCGLLFTSEVGLGAGSIIDVPTGIMMAVVSVLVGVFVLYSVWKTSETEIQELYRRLGVKTKQNQAKSA